MPQMVCPRNDVWEMLDCRNYVWIFVLKKNGLSWSWMDIFLLNENSLSWSCMNKNYLFWRKIVWVEVEWIFVLNESTWHWSWMNVYLLNVNINPWMKILCSWILLQTANHTPTLFKIYFFSWSLMVEGYKLFPLLVFSQMVGLKLGRKFALACQHIILKLGSHHGAVSVLKYIVKYVYCAWNSSVWLKDLTHSLWGIFFWKTAFWS